MKSSKFELFLLEKTKMAAEFCRMTPESAAVAHFNCTIDSVTWLMVEYEEKTHSLI